MSVATGPRRRGWVRPVAVPDDLSCLHGPLIGTVTLPLRVYSSGLGSDKVFHLDEEGERAEMYKVVLTNGAVEDVCAYLDRDELLRLWPDMWLPPHVWAAWADVLALARS